MSFQNFTQSSLIHSTMRILIAIFPLLISSVLSIELLLPSQIPPQLFKSQLNNRPLKSGLFNENCDTANGILLDIAIENCTNFDACDIIPKREYNVRIEFSARTASTNLIWRVITDDEVLAEERIVGDIRPGLSYTVTYSFAFNSNAEGKTVPVTFQIIDRPSQRIEICTTTSMNVNSWHMVPEILGRIRAPTFRNENFIITNYNAVNDGVTDNTEAFKAAIEACNAAGGGRVVVPEGTFLTGAITLLSNVNLHLMQGSTILFTHDTTKYPNVLSRTEGMELINYSPFIYAYDAENIGLTGAGVLDGNADCDNWWPWNGVNSNLQALCNITTAHPGQAVDLALLTDMVLRGVPVEERVFGPGHFLRPQFVQPQRSRNVLIEGITLRRSPMWILNPVLCENVIVRGVTIESKGPNSDGCDPESSKDVLIESVNFHTGDDCIAIKSGRNNDGRRVNVKSENIVIQDCQFQDGHGAFTIGSEISGGAKNVFFQDAVMSSPNLEQALRFKNNALRGGLIEDIFVRNVHISELYNGTSSTRGMVLSIDFNYQEGAAGDYSPVVRNVDIRNVTATTANYAFYLRGFPTDHISDIRLYDCNFDNVVRDNIIEFVDLLHLDNVTVNGEIFTGPDLGGNGTDCESVGSLRALTIDNCTDTTACKIITKREYNFGVTFVPSALSGNLIWRVTATIDGREEILTEQPIGSIVLPTFEYSFSFPLQFGTKHEGLSFPITYQILDAAQGRVEICGSSQLDVSTWHMVPEILSRISPPIFPNRDFSILTYDAVEGGEELNTEPFRRAIEACNAAGGGRVVVPAGVFLTSAIQLLSNVNLHLSEGSTILFTRDVSTYPIVRSRWEGMELMNYSPFIYAFETENIAITGTGTLDGNSDCFNWWPWKGRNNNLEIICGPPIEGDPTQEAARNVLLEMVENNVPVEDRIFGDGHYLRPQFVQPHRSKNVLIEDITLVRSPMWILNPVECENVIVRGVTINSTGPNSDGCDPESCKDVLIENVKFRTGDDCIAVKSGRNADGHRIGIKSENIVVQNCQFEDGHGGFTIGSEISGGAQNIFCQDCVMSSPQLEQALRFKNNAVRGALIEDIFIRNIQISELYTGTSTSRGMALSIDFNYEEGPDGNRKPIVRNIDIRNVTSNKSKYALYLRGFPDDHIEDVRLYDCHFHNVQLPNVIEHVDRLAFFNVTVNGTELIPPVPDCESLGTLRQFTIENCTDTTACNIITKREYNININFVPSTASSNLIWRVIATIDGEDVILTEQPLESDVVPNIEHSFSFPLQLGTQHEGLSFPITYQILDAAQGRVEICGSSQLDVSTWHMVPEILSRISPPIFPNRDFSILDYDAVEGGEELNTEPFRRAIEACNAAGGGRVVVPAGVFLTSAIQLLSNVNLHLSEGSTVLFTRDVSTYPIVRSRWEGMELMNYSPFIYAFETENIAITGTGTLDGNSDCFNWWPWKGRNNNLEIICGPPIEGDPTQEAARNVLLEMVENNVPVENRIFGDGHYLRPQFVQPHRSKNVLIEDITLVRSPMWILNPVECENVIVRGVTINSTGPNSDGCDPESCKDVLIENVKFRTGDDCIAVKSGRNADGHRIGIKSENIVVQNCQFEDGHGGFTIGSEISGGAQNIFCQDCVMSSPQLEQALRFKNNAVRGALIEDIFIRNIQISELYTGTSTSRGMALSIDFNYEEGPDGNRKPIVRNIDIRNVTSNKSKYALYLRGFPDDHIEDVRLYDCHFHNVQLPNVIEHVDRLAFFNVTVNGTELIPPVPDCESLGTLRQFTIENCTDTTACNIITKREYNININFVPSTASSNLIWRVIAAIDDEDVILTEQPLESDVVPNIEHSFSFPLQLGTQHEGLSFPITYQILDAAQGRVEICGSSQLDVSTWHMVPEILSRISPPIFPNRDFSILDYDAVEGGAVLNTEAFRRAIEACNAAGGGRVVVPAGVFLTSAIQLLSNVNLHLSEGSTVLFTRDVSTYPIVRSRWEGMELMNYSPFIYAFETENIAITGTGTLDGNSDCFNWWPWKGRNNNLEIICGPPIEGDPTQEAARNVLLEMVENNVPVEDRIFGDGHYLRPQFVQPHRSKNVLIEDITLVRSPMWILNPVECENVIVRGVTINSTGPNSDGCDPESCKDVLIENVKFRTGDDCIAVKSGRNADGHRIGIKSENIVVQNCQFEDGHGGFTIGSEISGGAQNIFCQDCVMSSPQLEQALRFKNNAVRGALIEDIFIRNIQISELYTGTSTSRGMALSIDFNYEEGPDGNRKPIVRNIDIRNVTSNKSKYALYLRGFPDDHIEDVRLYDCHFHNVQLPNFIEYVDRLALFNVTFNGTELVVPPSPEPPTDPTPTDPATTDPPSTDPPTTGPPSTDPPVTPTDPTDGPTDAPSSSSLLVSKTYFLILSIMAVVVVVKIRQ